MHKAVTPAIAADRVAFAGELLDAIWRKYEASDRRGVHAALDESVLSIIAHAPGGIHGPPRRSR